MLPWSAETEAALAEIQARIVALSDRLRALLGAPDAVAWLAAGVRGLRPASTDPPDDVGQATEDD